MSNVQKYTFATATAVIIANMVGTGVFTSLGFQLLEFQSGFLLLLLWFVGGVTAVSGAMSYAELGAALPRSGGEYNFLTRIYHPAAGFISGWVSATIGFAAPSALAAITFGAYVTATMGEETPDWWTKAFACGLIVVLAIVHSTNRKYSGQFQLTFTLVKIGVILAFCAAAVLLGTAGSDVRFLPNATDFEPLFSGQFAVALIYVSYAYTGWNAAAYLSSELDSPQKTLPRVFFAGTFVVMTLYVLLNFSFLSAAPTSALEGKVEIGYIAASHIFGEGVAAFTSVVLALLLISTVSAMTIAGPRVLQVIGEDFSLFKPLSRTNKAGVPATAIMLQSIVAIIFIITSSFQSILIFAGFVVALNSFLTVLGLFVFRLREPSHPRPYRVTFFPVTPLVYLTLSGWMLLYVVLDRPREAALGAGLIVIGLIVYAISRRMNVEATTAD